ncbi:MAG: hypothetical protein HYV18_02915 [Gammaproteobacteria bacterium]|nr:hypothetical protein [Gammaproteobacteria bacterium]
MIEQTKAITKRARRRGAGYLDRAYRGLELIVTHELGTLRGHYAELRERLAVGRRANTLAELIRYQMDLLPETRARLRVDHLQRKALVGNWLRTIKQT